MPNIKSPKSLRELPVSLIANIVTLATSGFGVVVALAWNEVIKNFVENFIDPYLGKNGSLVSLSIYAIAITTLAVIVTMQLTSIQKKLEAMQEKRDQLAVKKPLA